MIKTSRYFPWYLSCLVFAIISASVQAEGLKWTPVFESSQALYSLERGTVEILPGGVRAVFKIAPKNPEDWKGAHVLNTIAFFNKKRQMKTVYSIGFDGAGEVVFEGNPGNEGWQNLKPGSAYEAIWKVVMKDAGLIR